MEHISDADLRRLWTDEGGDFHGPNIETGTMPESKLLPFLRRLMAKSETKVSVVVPESYTEDTLLLSIAAGVSDPDKDEILWQLKLDQQRNPNNDNYGKYAMWPRRSQAQIVADHKLNIARTVVARLNVHHGKPKGY